MNNIISNHWKFFIRFCLSHPLLIFRAKDAIPISKMFALNPWTLTTHTEKDAENDNINKRGRISGPNQINGPPSIHPSANCLDFITETKWKCLAEMAFTILLHLRLAPYDQIGLLATIKKSYVYCRLNPMCWLLLWAGC